MEEVKQIIVEHWPEIVSYFFTFVSYFLLFLYRSKVNGTRNNVVTLFKEGNKEMITMKAEYEKAKRNYEKASKRLKNVEDALEVLLEDETEVSSNDEEN